MSRRFVLDAPNMIPSLEAIYKRPGSLVRETRFEPFLVKLGLCPSERAPNHPRRRAIDSSQHDLRLHSRAAFRPDRARQALQFGAFITRQRNPRRSRKVVDAALNYFSPKCDSSY